LNTELFRLSRVLASRQPEPATPRERGNAGCGRNSPSPRQAALASWAETEGSPRLQPVRRPDTAHTSSIPRRDCAVTRNSPPFLDIVRDAIGVRHYSIRTEQACLTWIRRFIPHHGKQHPREMGAPEVGSFLTHLAVDRNFSAGELVGVHVLPVSGSGGCPRSSVLLPGSGSWAEKRPARSGRKSCIQEIRLKHILRTRETGLSTLPYHKVRRAGRQINVQPDWKVDGAVWGAVNWWVSPPP
jgi:hypothetical protein